jgi:hypothetical protein
VFAQVLMMPDAENTHRAARARLPAPVRGSIAPLHDPVIATPTRTQRHLRVSSLRIPAMNGRPLPSLTGAELVQRPATGMTGLLSGPEQGVCNLPGMFCRSRSFHLVAPHPDRHQIRTSDRIK